MENNILSFENTLKKSIEIFKQFNENNDDTLKEEGIILLESAQQMITNNSYILYGTKWGVCVEYLFQKFNLDINTDDLLYELDVFINNKLNTNGLVRYSIQEVLWIGDYFLYRFLNEGSQLRYLSKKSIHSTILYYIELFNIPQNQLIYIEPLFYFPSKACHELKRWLLLLCEKNIYVEDATILLDKIYTLEKSDNFLISSYHEPDFLHEEIYTLLTP